MLAYKEQLQREYESLLIKFESDFKVFNLIGVIMAGKLNDLDNKKL